MFDKIQSITKLVKDETEPGHLPYALEHIKGAIERCTNVDYISICRVPVPDNNPVIGRYQRFDKSPSVYATPQTVVEIECAKHLNYCWSRFVICKEICQAIIDEEDTRTSTPSQLIRLCQSLLLDKESSKNLSFSAPFLSERLAEFAAMEILCPIEDRRKIVDKRLTGAEISDMQLAEAFRVPCDKIKFSFDHQAVSLIEGLYKSDEKDMK